MFSTVRKKEDDGKKRLKNFCYRVNLQRIFTIMELLLQGSRTNLGQRCTLGITLCVSTLRSICSLFCSILPIVLHFCFSLLCVLFSTLLYTLLCVFFFILINAKLFPRIHNVYFKFHSPFKSAIFAITCNHVILRDSQSNT